MKAKFTLPAFILTLATMISPLHGQEVKEVIQPLSDNATKGFLNNVNLDPNGMLHVTYKMKVNKKSDEVSYEEYRFDKDLQFAGTQQAQEQKEDKEDYERTLYYAYVGGSNSFEVLNMKLKLYKVVQLRGWNRARQYYETKKTISRETIKPLNDDGKVYMGYASYNSSDDQNTDLFVLAKADTKDEAERQKFYVLLFNNKLELKSMPVNLKGNYSLVYSTQLQNDDVALIFAPKDGATDISEYVYLRYDLQGNEKNRVAFKSPASALLITNVAESNGNVYFVGSSRKSEKPYEDVFSEYAPIYNPGWTGEGENKIDLKWQKSSAATMENIHLLKFSGNSLVLASSTPVKEFKEKFKTVKGDKGASVYKGKKFSVSRFYVTPDEEYLVAGQLTGTMANGVVNEKVYHDLICFHLDKQGNLKAQYGLGRSYSDKKSEVFQVQQNFYPGKNGTLYWEVLDVKGEKGYASFYDAYNGSPTFFAHYFPRIVTIDLKNAEMTSLKQMGEGKYFVHGSFPRVYDQENQSITYIGQDSKYKKLWVGQVKL